MSIKYYHLANDETPPEEFCAIKDMGGEPSEYTFYVPEVENETLRAERDEWHRVAESKQDIIDHMRDANAENAKLRQQLANVIESMGRVEERCAKLRELAENLKACNSSCGRCIELYGICEHETELRELGIEVK